MSALRIERDDDPAFSVDERGVPRIDGEAVVEVGVGTLSIFGVIETVLIARTSSGRNVLVSVDAPDIGRQLNAYRQVLAATDSPIRIILPSSRGASPRPAGSVWASPGPDPLSW